MPGFTSRDDLINEITVNGKKDEFNFMKIAPANAQGAGSFQSLWKGVGQPGAGADPATTPGTVYISDATTPVAGSMWYPDRSTDLRYLLSFGAMANQSCSLVLYDRLAGVSGISLATTGAKTVNSGALNRYSGTAAVNNEVWLEVTTATTTTAPVVNLSSYTAADGTTAQVGGSVTFPAAATVVGTMIQMPLTAAKTGVRSVEAGLTVGTAAAAGVVNVVILKRLATIPLLANQWNEVSFLDDTMGLPQVFDNATLGLMLLASGAVTTTLAGTVNCAYG
jgi:hypothetical protein